TDLLDRPLQGTQLCQGVAGPPPVNIVDGWWLHRAAHTLFAHPGNLGGIAPRRDQCRVAEAAQLEVSKPVKERVQLDSSRRYAGVGCCQRSGCSAREGAQNRSSVVGGKDLINGTNRVRRREPQPPMAAVVPVELERQVTARSARQCLIHASGLKRWMSTWCTSCRRSSLWQAKKEARSYSS